jgi:hypothetical protein
MRLTDPSSVPPDTFTDFSRRHANGWTATITQTDSDSSDAVLRDQHGRPLDTKQGSNEQWLRGALDSAAVMLGHECTSECGAWKATAKPAE